MTAETPTSGMIPEQERNELLVALLRNCCCERGMWGVLTAICPGHDALVQDENWLSRLHFVRGLRVQLTVEEWICKPVAA